MTPQEAVIAELQRASALCDLGRFSEAITLLGRLVASDPDNGYAWCLMAQAQLGQDEPANALEAARAAASKAPNEEWPHRLASVALGRLGRHREAAQAAREAVAREPSGWQTHAQLAHAVSHKGANAVELREAELAAGRAVAIAPDQAEAHIAAGVALAALGRRDDAANWFNRALEIDPQNSAAQHELARVRVSRNRLRAADPRRLADSASGFATALRTDPSAAVSRRSLDRVLRLFLAWTAYLVFFDAFAIARIGVHSDQPLTRILPVAFLLVPAVFAFRFTARLSADLRSYLFRLLLTRGIRLAAAVEAFAVAAILVGPFVSQSSRSSVAGVALTTAVIGRLILYRERRRAPARA
jgi:tetratricopeptide (TPR) repeat protein